MDQGAISKTELARRLGMSERHVYSLLKGKTSARDLAERIAKHYGGETEDYLRPPRRRGRTRPYPFRDFIIEKFLDDDIRVWHQREARDDCDYLAEHFWKMYHGFIEPRPPVDFVALEALASFIGSAGTIPIEQRDNAARLWKLFRLWREEQLYLERIFEIECEEFDDFG